MDGFGLKNGRIVTYIYKVFDIFFENWYSIV